MLWLNFLINNKEESEKYKKGIWKHGARWLLLWKNMKRRQNIYLSINTCKISFQPPEVDLTNIFNRSI